MNQKTPYTLGIDIGSTTVKIAILSEEGEVLFSDYERHFANILLLSLQDPEALLWPNIWASPLYRK